MSELDLELPEDVQNELLKDDDVSQSPEAAPPSVETPTQEPPASEWAANDYGYKYKGNVFYPKDRDHLIALAQKGHAFEINQEGLNKELRGIEEFKQKYEPYQRMDEFSQKNPEFLNKVNSLYYEYQNGNAQQPEGEDISQHPLYLAQQKEIDGFKQRFQQMDMSEADKEIDTQLEQLIANNKNYDWKTDEGHGDLGYRVMVHARDNGHPSLEAAFKNLMFDDMRLRSEMEAKKNLAEENKKNNKAGVVHGSAPAAIGAKKLNHKDHSLDELAEMALNEFQ